jgi:uncharacterized protein
MLRFHYYAPETDLYRIHSRTLRQAEGEGVIDHASAKRANSSAIAMTSADTTRVFPAGEAPGRLDQLRAVYARIAEAQARSLAAISDRGPALACPEGCGSCCEIFLPDVLPVESDFMADWLLGNRPDLAEAIMARDDGSPSAAPPCPFYESGREGGCCGIYPARPLVCRLFGFASVRDRDGVEAYSLCRWMLSRGGRRAWSGAELEVELGSSLPVMADYSTAAIAIAPEEVGDRALLTDALPASLRRLSLRRRLGELESADGPDGDEPEPSAPEPNAA